MTSAADRRLTTTCLGGAAVGLVPFLLTLWDFGIRPLRRVATNADFFDIQARALLHGHLDVPAGSLGIEAFVVDGRHYMYFGPFPSLLRMPLLALTDRLDGRLTALSMLAGWVVLAVATMALVRRVRRILRGEAAVGRVEAVALGAVVASITGGSTLVYLASQPWVYHEVYVWSTALAVATVASLVAAWDEPGWRRTVTTGAPALATMLTRVTAGWAMALAVVATGVWFLATRRDRGADWRRAGWGLTAGGMAALLVGSAVNWAKFRHPYLFPIGDQVWTQLSAHRRVVLAANGGRLDGPQFVPTTLLAYLRPDGVRFTSVFPFITAPAAPPSPRRGVLLDEAYRTGSVPALMPLLCALAVWGAVVAFRNAAAAALRIPLIACLAMTAGVLGFGYVAPRYTSEFLPLLALGAVIGVVDVAGRSLRAPLRRGLLVGMCALAAYGIVAHVAIGLVNSRLNWRGDRLADLVALQVAVGDRLGDPVAGRVLEVAALPSHGAADALAVVGDCDSLYLGTGETHGSWVAVEHRQRRFRLHVADSGLRPGSTSLMWFSGYTLRRLGVQVNLDGELRLVVVGATPDTSGHWLDPAPGGTIEIDVVGDTESNRFVATATGGGRRSAVWAPMTEWNRQFRSVPIVPHVALAATDPAARLGLGVETVATPRPELCGRLDRGSLTS
jgi:hypothetical protein